MTRGASSVRLGFLCGVLSTAIEVIVFRSDIRESLDYGIAAFAGATAYFVASDLLLSEDEYIDDGTETDN